MVPISIDISPQVWRRPAYASTSIEVVLSRASAKPSRVLYQEAFPNRKGSKAAGHLSMCLKWHKKCIPGARVQPQPPGSQSPCLFCHTALLSKNACQIQYLLGGENNLMFWFSPCSGVLDNFPSCSNWHCGVNKYGFVLNLVHSTTRFFFFKLHEKFAWYKVEQRQTESQGNTGFCLIGDFIYLYISSSYVKGKSYHILFIKHLLYIYQ